MAYDRPPRCSICDGTATGTFRYRTHNPLRAPSEPLCDACAVLTSGTACVTEFRRTGPPDGGAD